MRPALKIHGGKYNLAEYIIHRFNLHHIYIEPYAGGLSVLLNKPRTILEVANDINPQWINFYKVLKGEEGDEFINFIQGTDYSEESFLDANNWLQESDPFYQAAGLVIRQRMSRSADGKTFGRSDRKRGNQPEYYNSWHTFRWQELPLIKKRLQHVYFRNKPALEIIKEYDYDQDTLLYLDPPYLHSTRTVIDSYEFEMSEEQHIELLKLIIDLKSRVFISGYPSALYEQYLTGWNRVEWDMPNNSGQGEIKERRTEVLWSKP